jgi:hypothetical protein
MTTIEPMGCYFCGKSTDSERAYPIIVTTSIKGFLGIPGWHRRRYNFHNKNCLKKFVLSNASKFDIDNSYPHRTHQNLPIRLFCDICGDEIECLDDWDSNQDPLYFEIALNDADICSYECLLKYIKRLK